MWPFRRKWQYDQYDQAVLDALDRLAEEKDKGQQLNACANDVERRSLCLQWAGQMRDAYYQGRRESIQDMLLSKEYRYRHMSPAVRMKIGEIKWSKSLRAKELIGMEQMYSRWAIQYAGGPGSK